MDQLPKEIQNLILKKCDEKTRRIARVACTDWFKIIDYRDFSFYLTTKSSWPLIVDRMLTYNKPITLQLRKNIIKYLSDINKDLLRLTNITALTFDDLDNKLDGEIDEWFKLTSLPNLQSVRVNSESGHYNVPIEPLLSLPHLTRFCQRRIKETDSTEKLVQSIRRWTNLEHCELDHAHALPANGPFESYHTKLTSLSWIVPNSRVTPKWFEHLGNLKYLYYCNNSPADLSLKSLTALESLQLFDSQIHELNSTNLTKLRLTGVDLKFLEKELAKLGNLKELKLTLQDNSADNSRTYHWLTALTALESLNIYPIKNDSISFMSTNLTRLHIHMYNDIVADLSHLSKLTLLKELYLENGFEGEKEVDLSAISVLLNLRCLQIHFDNASHPIPFALSILSNLNWLDLAKAPADISHLPNLEHLDLNLSSDCAYTGFYGLPSLTNLQISIWRYPIQVNLDYNFLCKFTTLKTLSLNIKDEVYNCKLISALTALEALTLQQIESEEDYVHLANLKNLTKLQISQGITSANIQEIRMSLPEEKDDKLIPRLVQRVRRHFSNLHTYSLDW